MSQELFYRNINTVVRTPRFAVLVYKHQRYWKAYVNGIIQTFTQTWGGEHFIMIPTDGKRVKIKQLKPIDDSNIIVNQQNGNIGGICSQEYKKVLTCEQVDFTKKGSQVEFITVIELDSSKRAYDLGGDKLNVKIGDYDQFDISMKDIPAQERIVKSEIQNDIPAFNCTPIENQPNLDLWAVDDGKLTSVDDYYSFIINGQKTAIAKRDVLLNLEDKSIALRMRVRDIQYLKGLDLRLSNDRWSSTMSHSLSITYSPDIDGDWITINLGASIVKADNNAQWNLRNGDGFDWTRIDGIMLVATGSQDGTPVIEFSSPCTAPISTKGNIVFVIDDGNQTIDYAIPVFEKYNHKASIAAIGKYLDHHQAGFLTPNELTKIHERYNWDIVNHSYGHVAAVPTYIDKGMLTEYKEDVLKGSFALHKYGLDTNTNWFIYPLGSYNGATMSILDEYYRFARGQSRGPEVAPFAEPLAIKAFPVQDDTSVASIQAAIDNAIAGNHTLLFTLHRFKKTDNPNEVGYKIENLDVILKYLSDKNIQAKSLTELDQSLGIDKPKTEYQEYIPSYTKTTIEYTSTKPWFAISL